MELVVDEQGAAAPRLDDLTFSKELAIEYHGILIKEVVRMLCAGIVHGDLSEFNILIDSSGPVIIDLPQAVDASANNNASGLLERDVSNLSRYFGRFAPELLVTNYGKEIWKVYESGNLKPDYLLTGIYKQSEKRADVNSVMREINDARDDDNRRKYEQTYT